MCCNLRIFALIFGDFSLFESMVIFILGLFYLFNFSKLPDNVHLDFAFLLPITVLGAFGFIENARLLSGILLVIK